MKKISRTPVALGCAAALLLSAGGAAQASRFRTLYAFPSDLVGANPGGKLVRNHRVLYGTTFGGGSANAGTVFSFSRKDQEKTLYQFRFDGGGDEPYGVIADPAGNLYGVTIDEGAVLGTVFKVTPTGSETTLHAFHGGSDGDTPAGALLMDAAGALYGTTAFGGSADCSGNGCGIVYRLASDGTESVLHIFSGTDGAQPNGGLVADKAGTFYGVTRLGGVGCQGFGCGTVYKLSPSGRQRVLYAFKGDIDGETPVGELAIDKQGNLFGVASGGNSLCGSQHDLFCGIVFMIAPDGTKSILHAFDGAEGDSPTAGLVVDRSGNLYGTTEAGGSGCGAQGCGLVFRIAPDGTYTILHDFTGGEDGMAPDAPLVLTRKGHLFGTTVSGGKGYGTIFEITP